MAKNESVTNFTTRWRPDFRYRDDKKIDIKLDLPVDVSNSITDKEAYRLTLASQRGNLATGTGSSTVGSYSLKAGEEYNPDTDFSFLNRPDLTIVQIDEYIKNFKSKLESYDADLKAKVEMELQQAEAKKAELVKKESENKSE